MAWLEEDIKNLLDNFGDKLVVHNLTYIKEFDKKTTASVLTRFEINFDTVKDLPLNIKIYNGCAKTKEREMQAVKVALLASCAAELYHNETEYYDDGHGLSAESLLSCGAFNPSKNKKFEQKPDIIARGTVLTCEDVAIQTKQYYLLTVQILGTVFSVFVEKDVLPFAPKAGNVLSDLFCVVGLCAK